MAADPASEQGVGVVHLLAHGTSLIYMWHCILTALLRHTSQSNRIRSGSLGILLAVSMQHLSEGQRSLGRRLAAGLTSCSSFRCMVRDDHPGFAGRVCVSTGESEACSEVFCPHAAGW